MEWFLNLNFIIMIWYMLKATAALLIVLTIFAIAFCAFSVLLKFVINAIERD